MKKKAKQTSLIAGIIIVCLITFIYWLYNQFYITTDNAYVNANVVQVASQVTGPVQKLYVTDNQYVKQNQLLFTISPDVFQIAVDQAIAHVAVAKTNLQLANATETRTIELVKKRFASAQEGDKIQNTFQAAQANLQLAEINLAQAQLNLSYTKIYAATNGWITNLSLREGTIVIANQPQFALVSNEEFWVDANFKETEFSHLHPGLRAQVKVDMYPDYIFKGIVESISSGSGTAFSLLPPENATGNWVKVTQRVPVKIRILNPNSRYPLKIGTTATVKIRI